MAKKLQVIIDGKQFVTKATKEVEHGIKEMAKTTNDKSKAMVVAASTVKIAFAAVAAALGGLAVLTGKALKEAADMESVSVAFEVLIGDVEKAKKTLKDLRDFAAKTPLQFEDITKGAQQLMAFGSSADEVRDQLSMLGDVAMGQGDKLESIVRAYGKIQAKGRATMEELNMVTEAGVPILQTLADMYGTTTEEVLKLVSAGTVGFTEIDQAFKNMTSSGGQFYGMLERQSKTFNGMVSTLKDNLKLLMQRFGEAVLPTATKLLQNAMDTLIAFIESDKFDQLLRKVAIFAAQTYEVFSHIGLLISALYSDVKKYIEMLFNPNLGNLPIKYAEAIVNNLTNHWNTILKGSDFLWDALGLPETAKFGKVDFIQSEEAGEFTSALADLSLDLQAVAKAIENNWPVKETPPLTGSVTQMGGYSMSGGYGKPGPLPTPPETPPRAYGKNISLAHGMTAGEMQVPFSFAANAVQPTFTPDDKSAYNVVETIGSQFKDMWANSGLYDMFTQTLPEAFGGILGQIAPFIGSLSSVNQILNPLQTIMASMFETLAPVIDTVLAPVVGALKILGQLIGGMLTPVIQLLTPVIQFLAEIFIWLYNKVLLPAGNGFITVFNLVYNGIVAVLNGISAAVNWALGWAGVNMRTYEYKPLNAGHMKEIDYESLVQAGASTTSTGSYTGGGTGSNTSVQSVNITIYQTFSGTVIGDGGMEAVGEFVVDAIQAYSGVGGAVQVVST